MLYNTITEYTQMHKGELYKRGLRKYNDDGMNKMASLLVTHHENPIASQFIMEKAAGFEALWGAMKNMGNVPFGQGIKAVGSEAGNILKTNPMAAGGLIGAGVGATTAGEGNRLSGALMGGAMGTAAGYGIKKIPPKVGVPPAATANAEQAAVNTAEQAAAKATTTTTDIATKSPEVLSTTKSASFVAREIRRRQLGKFIQ